MLLASHDRCSWRGLQRRVQAWTECELERIRMLLADLAVDGLVCLLVAIPCRGHRLATVLGLETKERLPDPADVPSLVLEQALEGAFDEGMGAPAQMLRVV